MPDCPTLTFVGDAFVVVVVVADMPAGIPVRLMLVLLSTLTGGAPAPGPANCGCPQGAVMRPAVSPAAVATSLMETRAISRRCRGSRARLMPYRPHQEYPTRPAARAA